MPNLSRRERVLGVALVVLSAFGYGSGALLAKPIYEAGVDWMTLSAWRFLFGAMPPGAGCSSGPLNAMPCDSFRGDA